MSMQTLASAPGRSVRWPFRFLAALIVVLGFVGAAGGIWMFWQGVHPDHEAEIFLGLPAFAWLMNLARWAAFDGRSPIDPHWPFASDRVFMAYVAVWFFVWWR
jgi:hypothetical protein